VHTFSDKSASYNSGVEVTKLLQPGDYAPFSYFEPGDFIHAVEAFPGQGAIFARAAGSFCQVRSIAQDNQNSVGNSGQYVKVRLPSGSQRLISLSARATFGVVSSTGVDTKNLRKAGRSR
jgi:large subunit ribosomal protein L2